MADAKTIRNVKYKSYSVFMLLALAWLTVSLPFVYAAQQAQKTVHLHSTKATNNSDNSLGNTTEEKTETGVNTIAEYLHEVHQTESPTSLVVTFYKCHSADVYLAFHPEMICPPPDVLAS